MRKWSALTGILLAVVSILTGCGGAAKESGSASASGDVAAAASSPAASGASDTAAGASGTPAALSAAKVKTVLAWFSQPEDGGTYAALQQGYFKDAGLDVTVEPGSPQVSAVQLVAAGKAEFGFATGDDVLLARSQGLPLVAIAAILQKSPMVIMSREDQGIKDFADLSGHTVFVSPGKPYWAYIKKKYELKDIKEMSYFGDLTAFLADKNAVTQSYETNEPFALGKQGIKTEVLRVYDSGFQPYGQLLFANENFLKAHPDSVKAYVEAMMKGWTYYDVHYKDVNAYILSFNKNGTQDGFDYATEKEFELRKTDGGAFGTMTKERWETLQDQMLDLGVIKSKINIDDIFTNEFIPAATSG